jgi:hypothetical protein
MTQNAPREQLHELLDADLQADELKRLARVDALLREAAARDRAARGCWPMRPLDLGPARRQAVRLESIGVGEHDDHCPACRPQTNSSVR